MRLGSPDLPEQAAGHHNALAGARHNKVVGDQLIAIEAAKLLEARPA